MGSEYWTGISAKIIHKQMSARALSEVTLQKKISHLISFCQPQNVIGSLIPILRWNQHNANARQPRGIRGISWRMKPKGVRWNDFYNCSSTTAWVRCQPMSLRTDMLIAIIWQSAGANEADNRHRGAKWLLLPLAWNAGNGVELESKATISQYLVFPIIHSSHPK